MILSDYFTSYAAARWTGDQISWDDPLPPHRRPGEDLRDFLARQPAQWSL